jgi:hypothetical protein
MYAAIIAAVSHFNKFMFYSFQNSSSKMNHPNADKTETTRHIAVDNANDDQIGATCRLNALLMNTANADPMVKKNATTVVHIAYAAM